ncbi:MULTISPECIES: reverse transcriptase domain-containing protein [unclassified Microbacterium]|uniref:reverse transcriptase domain-containing protein n=1 Tax=unclassified Microbacterium TaxID=2609290 RepID=UPI000492FF51|nr:MULTISPECIES: reverse transcriptase domain-containing protein [unclassified Microbacterium]
MQLSKTFVAGLDLSGAARETAKRPLLQMPLLISERALSDATDELFRQTAAMAERGFIPSVEVISMPKSSYGPRPIGVLSPEARTLYHALVSKLGPSLAESSRDQGLGTHKGFGVELERPVEERIVDLDIAACYEYIAHDLLADELMLQGADAESVQSLVEFLGAIYSRGLGIPQALDVSHSLADTYLQRMDRGILRAGYDVNRFADDFRIVAASWAAAHEAIEFAVEEARRIGLTLSDGKTHIRKAETIRMQEQERTDLLDQYKSDARDELRSIEVIQVGYEDFEIEETDATDEEVDFSALTRIVKDWFESDRDTRYKHGYLGSQALRGLRKAPDRLDTAWLVEIVRREPARLPVIAIYLLGRKEADQNWDALCELTRLDRLSPWSRLWLLRTSEELHTASGFQSDAFYQWAATCLDDKFEVVRAEAAWVLATKGLLTIERVARLFIEATDVSRLGLVATAGKIDGTTRSKVGASLARESRLARCAYDWGTAYAN